MTCLYNVNLSKLNWMNENKIHNLFTIYSANANLQLLKKPKIIEWKVNDIE